MMENDMSLQKLKEDLTEIHTKLKRRKIQVSKRKGIYLTKFKLILSRLCPD